MDAGSTGERFALRRVLLRRLLQHPGQQFDLVGAIAGEVVLLLPQHRDSIAGASRTCLHPHCSVG